MQLFLASKTLFSLSLFFGNLFLHDEKKHNWMPLLCQAFDRSPHIIFPEILSPLYRRGDWGHRAYGICTKSCGIWMVKSGGEDQLYLTPVPQVWILASYCVLGTMLSIHSCLSIAKDLSRSVEDIFREVSIFLRATLILSTLCADFQSLIFWAGHVWKAVK